MGRQVGLKNTWRVWNTGGAEALTCGEIGEMVQSSALCLFLAEMETATKVGRYEIIGELGRGGMGVVYRAKDPVIGRVVAVKTIRLSEEGKGISHAELVERFQTEARAAGRLTHPNIVVVYDAGEEHGLYYITMELIEGKSLQSVLDAGHKLPVQRVLHIMEQVCSALQFAHDRSVVHRDIKPANIMLTRDDTVKITDFGTAKILQYGTSQKTNAIGTPGYMSPEQVKGKAIDGRSDIFSVGVMLYEMTTGQKPFHGQDIGSVLYKILNEEPTPPHRLQPTILPGVSSTIMKALAKSPHLRYESCRELLEDLQNYRPGGVSPRPKAVPQPSQPVGSPPLQDQKILKAEMPEIPGLEAHPAPQNAKPATPATKPGARPADSAPPPHLRAAEVAQIAGLYQEPKKDYRGIKRLVTWGAAVVVFALLGNFAVRSITSSPRSGSGQAQATPQSETSSPNDGITDPQSAKKVPYASQSNPEIAMVNELASPWSSKKFFFRSLSASKYVPALIVRLPGPAAHSNSYWAFSLEAPFSGCRLEYILDLDKISADYGINARHPMLVNPCSRTIFDPLQLKELPGNVLVRGAIVGGYDPRPPYGIDVSISGNRILATAME